MKLQAGPCSGAAVDMACNVTINPDQSSTQTIWVNVATRTAIPCAAAHLIRVGDVGAAVAGVPHAVAVPVQLVSVLDTLAVVQNVLQACWRHDDSVVWRPQQFDSQSPTQTPQVWTFHGHMSDSLKDLNIEANVFKGCKR